MRNPFRYFDSSPEVIRLAVMMYIRYPLAAGAAEAALEPIDQIYAGVAFQALPPRLVFGTRVVTD